MSYCNNDGKIWKYFTCPECHQVYIVFIIVGVLLFLYYLYMRSRYGNDIVENDILNRKVFTIEVLENCCSWWPITHFILFFILGFFFPYCGVLIITMGILWELLEMLMAKVTGKSVIQPMKDGNRYEYSENWWAGSMKDIIMNVLGFLVGKVLRQSLQI